MATQRDVARKMSREQKLKHQKIQKEPQNQFLNLRNEDGTHTYPLAERIYQYVRWDPDAVLNSLRVANALVHELRFHQEKAKEYLKYHEGSDAIPFFDEHGKKMTRDGCYLAHIVETQAQHVVVSRLRQHLIQNLLTKCDNALFTFDQFNQFVLDIEETVKKLGFELWPTTVNVPKPL